MDDLLLELQVQSRPWSGKDFGEVEILVWSNMALDRGHLGDGG